MDLKLIPYGCMATGPRTGFIEVVKNSKTIAEVCHLCVEYIKFRVLNSTIYEMHKKDTFQMIPSIVHIWEIKEVITISATYHGQ